jgi:hypothetical protein
MTKKIGSTRISLLSVTLLAATFVFSPCAPSAAQSAISTDFSAQQQQEKKGQQKKAAPSARPAPQRAAPQRAAPHVAASKRTAPRTVTQTRTQSHVVRQPTATTRSVRQPKATSRVVTQPKTTTRTVRQPKTTRKVVTPTATGHKKVSPIAAPRVVTRSGTRSVTAARLRGVPARGAGHAVIRGQNYSAWRSGYRIRHGDGWRTFVALSALGAIAIGSSQYYPYAYISAPQPYCEGLTEDGCELMWQEVETIEGDVINQCVAYCPWQ